MSLFKLFVLSTATEIYNLLSSLVGQRKETSMKCIVLGEAQHRIDQGKILLEYHRRVIVIELGWEFLFKQLPVSQKSFKVFEFFFILTTSFIGKHPKSSENKKKLKTTLKTF